MLLALGAILVLTLWGCEHVTTPDSTQLDDQDIAALKSMILDDPLNTSDPYVLNDGSQPSFSFGSLGKTETAFIPVSWGRTITSFNRDIQFTPVNDTTTIATLTHMLDGTVFIVGKYSATDTSRTTIKKPFTETTVRNIKFYRRANDRRTTDSTRKGWRPAEVSASKGGTKNSLVTITKLEITVGTQTIVITDPTEYYMKLFSDGRGVKPMIFNFSPKQSIKVRVTVTSADADTEWVALHRPLMLMGLRPEMVKPTQDRLKLVSQTQSGSNYQRVYEGSWDNVFVGRQTFFVSALTHSSLFDDKATFSSQIWGVPYITQ
jgi:hypothetical protein